MLNIWLLRIAALSGFIAVTLGAFGAHILKGQLSEQLFSALQTGVLYQFIHTLALILIAILLRGQNSTAWRLAGVAFALGILLFCGSLYLLSMTEISGFGPLTPLGGLCFLIGWLGLGWGTWQNAR